jgi:hypothetical protein
VLGEFGDLASIADTEWEEPYFDRSETAARLGDEPVELDTGLRDTIRWLRKLALIPT